MSWMNIQGNVRIPTLMSVGFSSTMYSDPVVLVC